jgi:hypothetical protein
VVAYGVAAAAVVAAVQISANVVDFAVYDYRFAAFDPNNEGGVFAWLGGALIAGAACLCLAPALRRERAGASYAVAGVLLAVFAVENRLRVHEAALHRVEVYGPLFGAVLVALLWLSRDWPPAPRAAVWAGLASLALSLVLHRGAPQLLAHFGSGPGDWPYELKVSLKESAELCGWLLVATGLAAAARRSNG